MLPTRPISNQSIAFNQKTTKPESRPVNGLLRMIKIKVPIKSHANQGSPGGRETPGSPENGQIVGGVCMLGAKEIHI
jgi:hypothetical protein